MAIGEFELIDRYFNRPLASSSHGVALGIGDDAAILDVPPGKQLVAALDTLVEGRHFLPGTSARSLGHRALAVNLSDLAAMGADPAWFLLALTMSQADDIFLTPFSEGMLQLAAEHHMALVGGDTTAGPLTVSVQVLGTVPRGAALTRSGAAPGDLLFVSGHPGDAAAGLELERGGNDADESTAAAQLRQRFLFPEPRVALGRALRGLASACIDVSDGLAGDAGKLAAASGCGVRMETDELPLSSALQAVVGLEKARYLALTGGDDYELCFTVPAHHLAEMGSRLTNVKCEVKCIGVMEAGAGVSVFSCGKQLKINAQGFDHFSARP
jgi:thiamine-monophosphate kinase